MIFDDIELKYKKLIDVAKGYMSYIDDKSHDINHMNDVVGFVKELLSVIDIDVDKDVCIIGVYWHDVGRIKVDSGHEKVSADMLYDEMKNQGYDDILIDKCYKAIVNHKWNMNPSTNEGLVIKDADKLGFVGRGRWQSSLVGKKKIDEIVELLPYLKKEILYFEESKIIFDREIVKIVQMLYKELFY